VNYTLQNPRKLRGALGCAGLALANFLLWAAVAVAPVSAKPNDHPRGKGKNLAPPSRQNDASSSAPAQAPRQDGEATSPTGDYIVVLKKGPARATSDDHHKRFRVSVGRVYGAVFKGYSAKVPLDQLDALKHDPRVAYVAPDLPVQAAAQTLPTGVNRIEGDLSKLRSGDGTGSVSSPGVAVLDSGSGPHTELNVVGGKACYGSDYNDGNGHGTHVAGIIGARDNAAGVVGVVPGVPIYSVRVLDPSLGGTTAALLCGIDWVTANAASLGIKVANLSLTMAGTDDNNCGNTNNDPVHKAICASVAKGVTYVVAAGNSATNFVNTAPANYNEVLTVTAMADTNGVPGGGGIMPSTCSPDVDDTAADFSNYTSPLSTDVSHTIAAPGKCINSTWKGGTYNLSSGTSMAAPHAAGEVALCITTGFCANSTPAKIISKMRSDAASQSSLFGFLNDPLRPLSGRYYGYLTSAGGYK
jgi:subtilisin